jgi:hypothetical protein
MTVEVHPIMLNHLNLVAASPLGGDGVKVTCVLISFNRGPDFASLFPDG